MCGIVGYVGNKCAVPVLIDGLEKLEYRGYDSSGIAVLYDNSILIKKSEGKVEDLKEKIKEDKEIKGNCGIGHTRWATHGAPTNVNAHPHISKDKKIAVVHNGIIENFEELKKELISEGYTFESETDTEVAAHLIEKFYDSDIKKAVVKATAKLKGAYALGVIASDEPEKIILARESSPLILGIGVEENFFASDITALVSHTKNVIYLEDGEFAEITKDKISVFDCTLNEIKKDIVHITWDVKSAEKDGFEHFMLKEITEQPAKVKASIDFRIKEGKIYLNDINFSWVKNIIITACGSSYYAGCAGKYAIEDLCKIPVSVELASELRYSQLIADDSTLIVTLSQSGETADTIASIKELKKRGVKVLSIVNVVGSTIASLSDFVLYTWAGPEISVATTKGYTTQLVVLYLLSLYLANEKGTVSKGKYKELLYEIEKLPKLIQEAIDMNSHIESIAEKYYNQNSMFFIGRNTDYAVSMEAALKMKEISYIHAEAYAAGELKHGTIALIDDNKTVVALCCNEEIKDKTINNIIEVKSRGAKIVGVACKDNKSIISYADDLIFVPKTSSLFQPIAEIVPMQLFSYYVARKRGCDIDKPKNLAKSVTVE